MSETELPRKKLLMIAYACDPEAFMESRLGWHRAVEAAKQLDTWVLCAGDESHQRRLDQSVAEIPGLKIQCVPRTPFENRFWDTPGCLYYLYNLWHRRAFQAAQELHKEIKFDLTHQVNFCGFREPGYLYQLDVPFIWGPLGGTQNFPFRFLREICFVDGVYEFFRGMLNTFDLRIRPRVRNAANKSAITLSANTTCQRDFKAALGIDSEVQLETGLRSIPGRIKAHRKADDPLNILWSGRLKAWKAFPLLMQSLTKLPPDVSYRVRVLGYGVCEKSWKRQAERLGIANRIEWVGWPSYTKSLEHYAWADVFAFTSLRDTSGTGLLEALSFGVPIIGLNHQGAADIITPDSGIAIDPKSKASICDGFVKSLEALYRSPDQLECLSRGALKRAEYYHWDRLGDSMAKVYETVLNSGNVPRKSDEQSPSQATSYALAKKHSEYLDTSLVIKPEPQVTSKNSRAYQGGLALLDQVICSATTLITLVLIARNCEKDCVGVYALALSLVLPLRVLLDRLISTPYMMLWQRDPDRAAIRLGSAFVHQAILCVFSIALAFLLGIGTLLIPGLGLSNESFIALAFLAPCLLWRDLLRSISFSHGDISAAMTADAIVLVTQITGMFICISTSHTSVNHYLIVTGLSSAVGCLLWFILDRKPFAIRFDYAMKDWIENWVIGQWLVAARVFGSAGMIVIPWTIAFMYGNAAAGVFATSMNLVGLSFMFSRGLNNYLRPQAIKAFHTGGGTALRSVLLLGASVFSSYTLCTSILFWFAGSLMMEMIYGPTFANTGNLTFLLSIASLATSLSMIADNGIMAVNRPDVSFYAEFANGVVTIVLGIVLISSLGLPGSAIAIFSGQLVGAAILIFSVIRLTNKELLPRST